MNTVLITGATGFVGRALSARMAGGPWRPRAAIRSSLQADLLPSGVEAVTIGSIGPTTDWQAALDGVDTVIHLAAAVPKPGGGDEDGMLDDVNVTGSRRLAKAAATRGVRRLVFLSSIEVNGTSSKGEPFTEADEPNPQTPYGRSKLKAERELLQISRETGLEVVIIRPPLIYGPGKLGNLMSFIMSLINRGVPLPLASITNQRSFIYIENLLDAIISCCSSETAAGHVFLVSDGQSISTPELIRMIAVEMNKKPRLVSFPTAWIKLPGKGDAIKLLTDSYYLDSRKIRQVAGWRAPYSMAEGVSASLQASMDGRFADGPVGRKTMAGSVAKPGALT